MSRKVVGVSPPTALDRLTRLFETLEAVLPVRFRRFEATGDGSDGFLILPGSNIDEGALPGPALIALAEPQPVGTEEAAQVELSRSSVVETCLRGRMLADRHARVARPLEAGPGDEVLARTSDGVLWLIRNDVFPTDVVAIAPEELPPNAVLRDVLRPGRFLPLLPLLSFLRRLAIDELWDPPPLQAAFVIDDPNLHWPSYGYVRFDELARDGRTHGYHVAMATIPLDGWRAHRAAVQVFKSPDSPLSLLVHGNDHVARELGREISDSEGLAALAQALRRVAKFEERTNVRVSRVMSAPHGACSEQSMRAMLALGFEAVVISRPQPWLRRPPADQPLSGWPPLDLVVDGFPVIPRHHLASARDELIFRAFLRRPLVPYGHHVDLAEGPDVLAEAASEINSLGDVRWTSLEQIARSSFETRRDGSLLRVRPYSRWIELCVPDGIDHVVVEPPVAISPAQADLHWSSSGVGAGPQAVAPGDQLSIRLGAAPDIDPLSVPPPPFRPWPLVRRVLTESRDRLVPVVAAIGRRRGR